MKTGILEQWRAIATDDEILTKELQQKDRHLADAFTSNMEFGTAGIRGVMGAGTNKMNIHTVAAAAEAYAQFLIKNVKGAKTKGVVVGHDNRHNSTLFSETVANVLMNNGIKAYLFEGNELQPTPLVSYVIRKMKLAGGAIVTASHNPKEYNGFKVYNQLGGQLMPEYTKTIQENMAKLDVLKVEKTSTKKVNYIPSTIIDSYIKDLFDKVQLRNDEKTISVAFSSLHGTSGKLAPRIFEELGYEHYEVEKQLETRGDFKYVKSSNPEEAKAYNKVVALARRKKTDIAIVTDPDADRIGAIVKYQRRYKYLNGNQMAALYLDYKLTQLKRMGELPKDGYIVKSVVSGNLPARIAEKFGIKVIETHVGFKNIAEVMENTSGTFIMGYEESYGFVLDKSLTRDKDSLQAMIGILEMTNYYKSQNINVYEHLESLWRNYGIHRSMQISKKIDSGMTKRLIKRISKIKGIANKKAIRVEDYRRGHNDLPPTNLVKVIFEDGSWLAIRPSGTEPKAKIYIQTTGSPSDELLDIVTFEKQVADFLDDNTETFEEKNFSWKTFFKYIIFIGIIVGIMAFVFLKIYSHTGGSGHIFSDAKKLINYKSKYIWLLMWVFMAFNIFLGAWMRKRLISFQGQKVKTRHLFISSLMGSIISFITPLAIGGDAIGYWYLRRKGIKRGPLLSSFMTSTIIWQFGFVLQTAILVPLGIPVYKGIMFSSDPHSKAAFSMFCIGLSWDIFATIMLTSLTLSKRFQEFIVVKTVIFLEWIPFKHISDAGALISNSQYEFSELRSGFRKIWKRKRLVVEIMFYELLPKLFSGGALLMMWAGVARPDLWVGPYLNQIITSDMKDTANTLSLTPGGAGTGEWLTININKHIYSSIIWNDPSITASATDLAYKLFVEWPKYLIATLLIFTIIVGEKRRHTHNKRNKNILLNGGAKTTKSSFYKKISIFWVLFIAGMIVSFVIWA